jgi:two-component system, sensor histidine kinase and response regulator
VLIADDNTINQVVVARMVRALGYDVEVVSDGEEALAALRTARFDAVLMDWQMPGLDGLAATRKIRAMNCTATATPIIALTANAFPRDRDACLSAGMSDYVAKPVELQALREVLARWVPEGDDAVVASERGAVC